MVTKIGDRFYNVWRDAAHPKGLWRRTTLDEYRKPEPAWETVLDLDALSVQEGENWVWHGASVLEPQDRLCLVSLSRGGADADVVREFDLEKKAFVAGGFTLPEAKSRVAWRSADSLFVATDFGPGSLTASGYPRTIREWTRGTPLPTAPLVYEGQPDDMSVTAWRDLTPDFERDFVVRRMTRRPRCIESGCCSNCEVRGLWPARPIRPAACWRQTWRIFCPAIARSTCSSSPRRGRR